ncbi:MAG: phosphoribosylglycinamide formyltransferase [Armatimonadetes bacterium]|nr:phosphoribosylglycinamide formyltransferase [Armatimonadota bacterium]
MMKKLNKINLAVLISGNGSNLQAIIREIQKNNLSARINVVISSNHKAYVLIREKKAKIPIEILNFKDYIKHENRKIFEKDLIKIVKKYEVDLIVLAGFMVVLSKEFLKHFSFRVINLHPSILPKRLNDNYVILPDKTKSPVFRGLNAISQALKHKVSCAGCTVHFVSPQIDKGKVITQALVPVKTKDDLKSLTKKIHLQEHKILIEAIKILIKKLCKF